MVPWLDRGGDGLCHQHGAHGQSAGNGLGEGEQIGCDSGALIREKVARASQTALDLVIKQRHLAFPCERPQLPEIPLIEHTNTTFTLYRFNGKRGRRLRGEQRREPFNVPLGDEDSAGEWAEWSTVCRAISRGQGGEETPVECPSQPDYFVLGGPSDASRPTSGKLERALICFHARVAEEDAIGKGPLRQLRRKVLTR